MLVHLFICWEDEYEILVRLVAETKKQQMAFSSGKSRCSNVWESQRKILSKNCFSLIQRVNMYLMNREGYSGEVMTLRWKTEKLCAQNKVLYMIYIAKKVTGFDNFIYTACFRYFYPSPSLSPSRWGATLNRLLTLWRRGQIFISENKIIMYTV